MKHYETVEKGSNYWESLTQNGHKPMPTSMIFKDKVKGGYSWRVEVPVVRISETEWEYESFPDGIRQDKNLQITPID